MCAGNSRQCGFVWPAKTGWSYTKGRVWALLGRWVSGGEPLETDLIHKLEAQDRGLSGVNSLIFPEIWMMERCTA